MTCRAPLVNAPLDHLARCDRGATIRVSSADLEREHHPLYLIDGRIGSSFEKWSSLARDRRPWVEISWTQPRRVRKVVVHHAGVRDPAGFNTVDFDLLLRTSDGWRTVAAVRGNRSAVSTHEVPATSCTALRLEILQKSLIRQPHARLYELEVHGD
jgi:hypothetical protein